MPLAARVADPSEPEPLTSGLDDSPGAEGGTAAADADGGAPDASVPCDPAAARPVGCERLPPVLSPSWSTDSENSAFGERTPTKAAHAGGAVSQTGVECRTPSMSADT